MPTRMKLLEISMVISTHTKKDFLYLILVIIASGTYLMKTSLGKLYLQIIKLYKVANLYIFNVLFQDYSLAEFH